MAVTKRKGSLQPRSQMSVSHCEGGARLQFHVLRARLLATEIEAPEEVASYADVLRARHAKENCVMSPNKERLRRRKR